MIDHPLISREELQDIAAELLKSASRIGEGLIKLKNHAVTEVISEFSEADKQAFKCVSLVTERIRNDVKVQFKGKRKPKKKAT